MHLQIITRPLQTQEEEVEASQRRLIRDTNMDEFRHNAGVN